MDIRLKHFIYFILTLISINTFAQAGSWNLLHDKEVARFDGSQVYETDSFYIELGLTKDSFETTEHGFSTSKVSKIDESVVATNTKFYNYYDRGEKRYGIAESNCSNLQLSDIPTVDSKNEWVVNFKDWVTSFGEIRVYTFAQTDTLINGKYYKEMIYHTISDPSTYTSTSEYYRQVGDKVFFHQNLESGDILLADFGLSVGDTLDMNFVASKGAPLVIAARDTIVMNDEKGRIQLKYYCVDQFDPDIPNEGAWWTMIEGLGTFGDMFSQLVSCSLRDPFHFRNIRCYYEDGRLVYKDANIGECFISTTSNVALDPIKIFPNPAYDVLNINSKTTGNDMVASIINAEGKVMAEIGIKNDTNNIDISALNSGVYTVKLMENNQMVFVTKFIKIQ